MLTSPTMEHLQALKLDTMAAAWTAQQQQADLATLAFDDRFGLLVEAEWAARENRRFVRALQDAKLKLSQVALRPSTTRPAVSSTRPSSASSPPVAGSPSTTT